MESHQISSSPSGFLLKSSIKKKTPFRFSRWKWFMLFLMNIILLGNFYCYDNPQGLQTHLTKDLNISATQYNLLYSMISFPNIILPLVGGYITDYFGVRRSLIFFISLVTIGQALFTYGTYTSSYEWLIVGRFVYGLGTDTLSVAETTLASQWFEGGEQAFAIALSTTVFGISSVFDTLVTPRLQEYGQNLYFPTMFGLILCIFSQLITFILFWMDRENERREADILGATLLDKTPENEASHKTQLHEIRQFKKIFWWLAINFGLAGSIFFTFTNVANDYIGKRFGFNTIEAGNLIIAIYVAMAISAPTCGLLVDKYGRRIKVLAAACILGIGIYVMFGFLPSCDKCYTVLIPLIGLGIFLGGYDAGVMPSLPLVLEKEQFGIGFGLYYVAQNITMTIVPLIAGSIIDSTSQRDFGYYWMSIFMIGYCFVTLLSCIPVFIEDVKLANILNNFRVGEHKYHYSIKQSFQQTNPGDLNVRIGYTSSDEKDSYKSPFEESQNSIIKISMQKVRSNEKKTKNDEDSQNAMKSD